MSEIIQVGKSDEFSSGAANRVIGDDNSGTTLTGLNGKRNGILAPDNLQQDVTQNAFEQRKTFSNARDSRELRNDLHIRNNCSGTPRSDRVTEVKGNQSHSKTIMTDLERQNGVNIDPVVPYTTEDLKEALNDIQKEVASHLPVPSAVARFCSPQVSNDRPTFLATGVSLLTPLGINRITNQQFTSPVERSSDDLISTHGSDELPGKTDLIHLSGVNRQGRGGVFDKVRIFSGGTPCAKIKKFMGELLSPRDTDIHDLSDHELLSKTDAPNEHVRIKKSDLEDPTQVSSVQQKTVRFVLDENESLTPGLTKKVSGIFSSSSESSTSSSPEFQNELSISDDLLKDEESPVSEGVKEGRGSHENLENTVTVDASPRIYFSDKELPLITCLNEEQIFDLDDFIPTEITIQSSQRPSQPPLIPDHEEAQKGTLSDEILFTSVSPIIEFPTCDSGCAKCNSETDQDTQNSDKESDTNPPTDNGTFDSADDRGYHQRCSINAISGEIPDTPGPSTRRKERKDVDGKVWFQEPGLCAKHSGSFSANDLPMVAPTAFRVIREESEDNSEGRCSSGSLDVIPSNSRESLTITEVFSNTMQTSSEPSSESSLRGFGEAPILLRKSLQYLAEIHQLEKLVQDGNRQVQALKEEGSKHEQEYAAELLALRQSVQRELEESQTQSWMVEKRLTQQVKCLKADNSALMRQVNHTTDRMQEIERNNTMTVVQYHNALSTLKAVEKEHRLAQEKVRELKVQLRKSAGNVSGSVEQLTNEKQELTEAARQLNDRLVGQKEVNSRLLSEIEKMAEERKAEMEKIKEENERELRSKTNDLKNKLDLQTARLRKEHSTTEILKAEFTSIRRELESQISSRDVKIVELRRHQGKDDNDHEQENVFTDKDVKNDDAVDEAREILLKKESEVRVLQNALTDENKKFVDVQAELKEREAQIAILGEDLEESKQLLEDATDSCRRLKRLKCELDEQMQSQGSEIVLLREYLASRDRRIVQMAADLSRRDRRIMTLLKDLRRQSSCKAAAATATERPMRTHGVIDESASSSSSGAVADTGGERSKSDQSSEEDQEGTDEAMGRLENQVELLKQHKLEADNRIKSLHEELDTAKRQGQELARAESEKERLSEGLQNLEDMYRSLQESSPKPEDIQSLEMAHRARENDLLSEISSSKQTIEKLEEELARERAIAQQENGEMVHGGNECKSQELENSQMEVSKLKEEMEKREQSTESQITALSTLITSYKEHIESQDHIRKDSEQMIGHYISENTELKSRLEQAVLGHESMISQIAAAIELKTFFMKEKEQLESEREELQSRIELFKQDKLKRDEQHKIVVSDLSEKLEQKQSELTTTAGNLGQVLTQIRQASEYSQDLGRKLVEREDEIRDLSAKLQQLESERDNTAAENTVLRNEREAALQKISDLELERTESRERVSLNEEKNDEMMKEITDLNVRLTCEMNSYEHLKTLYRNSDEARRKQDERLQSLDSEMVDMKSQHHIKCHELENLAEQNKHLETEIRSYLSQCEQLQDKVECLEKNESDRQHHIKELEEERDVMKKKGVDLHEQVRAAEGKIDKLEKTLKLKKKKIIKLEKDKRNREADDTETSLANANVTEETREQLQPAIHQQEEHQRRILMQEMHSDRVTNLTRDIAELREGLGESRAKLDRLTENQALLTEENDYLDHELVIVNAALEDEKKEREEDADKMRKVVTELKHKRLELRKAKKEIRVKSRTMTDMMSTLNQTEGHCNDLGHENYDLSTRCVEKDAQIKLLQEIIDIKQEEQTSKHADPPSPSKPTVESDDKKTIRLLEQKLDAAEAEMRSMKALNCRISIDLQVKSDFLQNQRSDCSLLQSTVCDMQQTTWDLNRRLDDAKHKLQTERHLRHTLQERYDEEMKMYRQKMTSRSESENRSDHTQSLEIRRKLSKLEELFKSRPQESINASDDQRQMKSLKTEIDKLENLRDFDRLAIDGLCAELGEIRSLLTCDAHHSTSNQEARHSPGMPGAESQAMRVQRALRKAELRAMVMTSVADTQSPKPSSQEPGFDCTTHSANNNPSCEEDLLIDFKS